MLPMIFGTLSPPPMLIVLPPTLMVFPPPLIASFALDMSTFSSMLSPSKPVAAMSFIIGSVDPHM